MSRTSASIVAGGLILSLALVSPASASSSAVSFGRAETFAILAATGITNTGPTTLSGTAGADIGSYPNAVLTGSTFVFTDGHHYFAGSDVVIAAQQDLGAAYDQLASQTPTETGVGEIGGRTLTAGVYSAPAGIAITGDLILDGEDDPDAVFIFQAATTLVTATSSTVSLINGAQACNVVWQVGSSATLNTSSQFAGAIAASESISVSANVTVLGQLLAVNGSVTLADQNTVVNDACVEVVAPTDPEPEPEPEPESEPEHSESDPKPTTPANPTSPEANSGNTGTVDGGVLPNTGSTAWLAALGIGTTGALLSLWAFARWRRKNYGHA